MSLPRLAEAFQSMWRKSSSRWWSRRDSNSLPSPRRVAWRRPAWKAPAFARHVGKHLHRLGKIDLALALDEAERSGDAVKDGAEEEAAPAVALEMIGLHDFFFRREADDDHLGAAGKVVGRRVNDVEERGGLALVDKREFDLHELRLLEDERHVPFHPQGIAGQQDDVGEHGAGEEERQQQAGHHAVGDDGGSEREHDGDDQREVEARQKDHEPTAPIRSE
jgi:hypothetical protein